MEPTSITLSTILGKWWLGVIGFFWWKTKKAVEDYDDLHDRVTTLESNQALTCNSIKHLKELLEIKLNNIEEDVKEIKTKVM